MRDKTLIILAEVAILISPLISTRAYALIGEEIWAGTSSSGDTTLRSLHNRTTDEERNDTSRISWPWWMEEWPFWLVVVGVFVVYWHITRHWLKRKGKRDD